MLSSKLDIKRIDRVVSRKLKRSPKKPSFTYPRFDLFQGLLQPSNFLFFL